MSQTIKLKRGTTTPTTSDIVSGEVAVDTSAQKLYVNDAGTVKQVGVSVTGDTMTGDLSFGDSDKAIFGAGDDLQIYHDGSNSYIKDAGTGNLLILANDFRIRNAAGSEDMLQVNQDGNVKLSYNGSTKLATTSTGADVTGTLTADGLTVDGAVDVNLTSNVLDVSFNDSGYVKLNHVTRGGDYRLTTAGSSADNLALRNGGSQSLAYFASNGDVSLFEDTGTTAKFFWDASAENLQLSLNGEALKLGSSSGSDDTYMSFQGSRALVGLDDSLGTITGTASSAFIKSGGNRGIAFNVNNASTSAMVLNSSGNVGIGTSNPQASIHTTGSALIGTSTTGASYEGVVQIADGALNGRTMLLMHNNHPDQFIKIGQDGNTALIGRDNADELAFGVFDNAADTTLTKQMVIDSSGNVGIGTANPQSTLQVDGNFTATGNIFLHDATSNTANAIEIGRNRTVNGAVFLDFHTSTTEGDFTFRLNRGSGTDGKVEFRNKGTGAMSFLTNNTEAMRIDSSGDVSIGTTTATKRLTVEDGNDAVARFNRTATGGSSTGSITEFSRAGTLAGHVGSQANNYLYIGQSDTNLAFSSANNLIFPRGTDGAARSEAIDLGNSSNRFKSIYATNQVYATTYGPSTDTNTKITFEGSDVITIDNGGSESMRLTASGRLGLNITSPSSMLHVKGDTTGVADTVAEFGNGSNSNSLQVITSDGNLSWGFNALNSRNLVFQTNQTERMRIDSSGNVGLGTTAPDTALHLSTSASTGSVIRLENTTAGLATNDLLGAIEFEKQDPTASGVGVAASIKCLTTNLGGNFDLTFSTGGTGGNNVEAMRINDTGDLLIGKTSYGANTEGIELRNDGLVKLVRDAQNLSLNRITSTGTIQQFKYSNTEVGTIDVTATTTTYNTSSDRRLKENITDADDAGDLIDSIRVRKFDWKADGSHQPYGMIAQELLEPAPEAVSVPDDPDGMLGVDYSKLVPMLIKEIQSLRARVAQLEEQN